MQWLVFVILFGCFCESTEVTYKCSGQHAGIHYCQFEVGSADTKIIIAAPHGGELRPERIANRTNGCWIDNRCVWDKMCEPKVRECRARRNLDTNTNQIAQLLTERIEYLTGKRPHLILNNLHRLKLDLNRELNQAAFGDPEIVEAYEDYHGFIKAAKSFVNGTGVFFDIHGQNIASNLTLFGYLLKRSYLNNNASLYSRVSSIKALDSRSPYSFDTLVRGDKSLGYYLQNLGYRIMPSPAFRTPVNSSYFNGGYSTFTYGSRESGLIDSIQIEVHELHRQNHTFPAFANDMAKAIVEFMREHY